MAYPTNTSTWWNVISGGSDTANGGGHNGPFGNTGNWASDLTCTANTGNTSTPEVSSATYTFVSGDIGNWLVVAGLAGNGWISGWAKITAVSGGKATLDCAVGHVTLSTGILNTVVGIANVGTPTGGIFTIDYSLVTTAPFSLSGLTSAAANAIILTSAATVAMIGNMVVVTGGTNATTGTYLVTNVSAGVSLTVDRNWCTGAVSAGTANLGGALATPGGAGAAHVGQNRIWIQANVTYTLAVTTVNAATGPIKLANGAAAALTSLDGYTTYRGDGGQATIKVPTSGVTSITIVDWATSNANQRISNIIVDGSSKSSIRGIGNSSVNAFTRNCKAMGCTNYGFLSCVMEYCEATNITGGACCFACNAFWCYFHGSTVDGMDSFGSNSAIHCIFDSLTGASTDAIQFSSTTVGGRIQNCTFYNIGRHGVNFQGNAPLCAINDNIFDTIGGYGITGTVAANNAPQITNNAFRSCTSGNINSNISDASISGTVVLTTNPFVSVGTNFALNNTSGGGSSCRAAGAPGAFPGLAGTIGYLDIGAVQSRSAGPLGAVIMAVAPYMIES